jgi:hypothetical protein
MRTARRKGNIVLVFIAVHMVLVFSCSINEGEIQHAVQDSIDTRNSPKTTDLSGDGMSSNGTTDAAWTDPAETTSPGGTSSWSPYDCSAMGFLRYELKNQTEKAYSGNNICHYEWHITNVDDTIHIRLYRLEFLKLESTGVVYDNDWVSTGTLKPGELKILYGWLERLDTGVFYSKFTKLAAIFDLDQCEWLWKEKQFDAVAVDFPPPCEL